MSSHILSELAQMCTDIGIIDAGKIVLSGNMGDILRQVNDSNPIRVQVVENVREAVQFLRAEPEVRTITVDSTAEKTLRRCCLQNLWPTILESADSGESLVTLRASSCRSRIMIWKRW